MVLEKYHLPSTTDSTDSGGVRVKGIRAVVLAFVGLGLVACTSESASPSPSTSTVCPYLTLQVVAIVQSSKTKIGADTQKPGSSGYPDIGNTFHDEAQEILALPYPAKAVGYAQALARTQEYLSTLFSQ